MRYFSLLVILVMFGCGGSGGGSKKVDRVDTMVAAYVENGNWRFNTAKVYTHMGRKFKDDSTLAAENGVVQQISLQLPPVKADSIMDTVSHKLLKIIPRYGLPIADSLNKYVHLLDTLHYK
jgi:hypothetical protein